MKRMLLSKEESNKYIKERKQSPCFICEIVKGKPLRNKHYIIFENEKVIVFLSAFPTHLGQTLVCPKQHVEQVAKELNQEEYLNLQKIIFKVSKAIQAVLKPERLYIASFGSQQMNKHVHFHIVPLPKGIPIDKQQMAAMMFEEVGLLELTNDEWQSLANKIRSQLQ